MYQGEFHSGLRALLNIDKDELENADVINDPLNPSRTWGNFKENPFQFYISSSLETLTRLWPLVSERTTHAQYSSEASTARELIDRHIETIKIARRHAKAGRAIPFWPDKFEGRYTTAIAILEDILDELKPPPSEVS